MVNALTGGPEGDLDYVNTFVVFLTTFVSGMFLGFYGLNNSNFTLAGMGFLFSILSISAPVIVAKMDGQFFKPDTTVYEGAFIFWITAILINVGGLIEQFQSFTFSAFTPPGEAYAASAISGEPTAVQTLAESFLAAQGENMALIALGLLFITYTRQQFGDNLVALVAGIVPMSLIFMGIHTEQLALANLGFLASAGALIFVVGAIIFGSDVSFEVPGEDSIVATLAFFGGLHFGLNTSNTHGLLGVFVGEPHGILNVPAPELFLLALGITAIYAVSFYYFVKYIALQVM